MGNLAQYVDNATNVINEGNYSELDGLVFSQLVYTKYDSSDIVWTQSELENGISVKEFAQKMISQGKNCMGADEKELLEAISHSERYSHCVIKDLAGCDGKTMWDAGRISTLKDDAQWGAMTIKMNDGSGAEIIAMRGTTDTTLAWSEDFELGYERYGTTAERLSRDYLNSSEAEKIYMVGHSKGGNDCTSAYMMSGQDVRDRVVRIENFDGPGHNEEFLAEHKEAYSELAGKQHNYYPKDSIVGQLLHNNPGTSQFVETEDVSIMNEHILYNWKVEPSNDGQYHGFKDAGCQSEISQIMDQVVDENLSGMSSIEKANVINAIIKIGIPAFIAKNGEYQYLDYSSLQAFLNSVIEMKGLSPTETISLFMIVKGLLEALKEYCVVHAIDFALPHTSDLYYPMKNLLQECLRNTKNALADFLNLMFYGNPANVPKEASGYNPPDQIYQMYDFRNNNQGNYDSSIVMSACFSIHCDNLKINANSFRRLQKELLRIKGELEPMTKADSIICTAQIGDSIQHIVTKIDMDASDLMQIGNALESVVEYYQHTEQIILAESL